MKTTFILGYIDSSIVDAENQQDLILFPTKEVASYESDEWKEVVANSLEEAKEIYHSIVI